MFNILNKTLLFGKSLILSLKWIYFLIIFKYNFTWITKTKEGGVYLKNKLLNLGIIGIKFGQFLHTEFISKDVKEALSDLLTNNIVHSMEDTYKMINYEPSDFINNIDFIDSNVLGSGSLAQVHECYLKNDPNKYILKVAHPCIFELEHEISTLQYILKTVSYLKKINIDWDSFFKNIIVQCDLNNEAENMQIFYEIYKNYDKIEIPKLIYSSKYFIIMSYCEGVTMNTLDSLSNEYILATNILASSFLHTTKKYNICHGDLHQGNILVKPNGYIALIDFGICHITTKKSDGIYIYRKLYHTHSIDLIEEILSVSILEPYTNPELDTLDKITDKCKSYFNQTIKNDIENMDNKYTKDLFFLNFLLNFCYEFNLKIDGKFVNTILQLLLLEAFAFTDTHNGRVQLRTLSYMKTDDFFMNELGDYILEFHKLEYDNEPSKRVKQKYP